jgi:alkylation response protein AidB-like acyl-CoA dehydrogenase
VFGKPLLAQAVIRQKFAHMIAKVEAIQAWLESVTFQMCNMVSDTSSLCAVSGSIVGRKDG